jgi:hypothetical protein
MDDPKLVIAEHGQYFDWMNTAPGTALKPEALDFIKGE